MAKTDFEERKDPHDEIAVPYVMSELQAKSLEPYLHGAENTLPRWYMDRIRENLDMVSLSERFRPDIMCIPRGYGKPKLVEVKCTLDTNDSFSMEYLSLLVAIRTMEAFGEETIFVFVEHPNIKAYYASSKDIPRLPINFPETHYNKRVEQEVLLVWTPDWDYDWKAKPSNGKGSHTPYFFIKKDAPYLKPLEDFMYG